MKILLAGAYRFPWYEEACARALETLGYEVVRFSWDALFATHPGKFEEHFAVVGPVSRRIHKALAETVAEARPDVLWIWRGTHITAEFLVRLKRQHPRLLLVSYNNDDAFSPLYDRGSLHQRRLWRHFRAAIPAYDLHFVFRPLNIEEYRAAGAKRVKLLLPYFVPELHRPLPLSEEEKARYACDCVFVGHFESDGRDRVLLALARAGLRVRVYGHGWPKTLSDEINGQGQGCRPIYGDEYAKVLSGTKLALAFLSKLNRDEVTRRHFEIPACGSVLFTERSSGVLSLFREDEEIVCFGSPEEALAKALACVRDPVRRQAICQAGQRRVHEAKHDVVSRMRDWVYCSPERVDTFESEWGG